MNRSVIRRVTAIAVGTALTAGVLAAACDMPDRTATAEQAGAPAGTGRVLAGQLDAGDLHTCALLDDGMRCWGSGEFGQLGYANTDAIGDDETPGTAGPVDLGAVRSSVAVSAGTNHTCAVLDDGSVRCWGLGLFGQLGYANTDAIGDDEPPGTAGPVDLGAGRTGTAVTTGASHTCAVLDDGSVRCWGFGGRGQLGYGNPDTIGDNETPGSTGAVDLGPGRTATAVSAGANHTCVVLDDGSVRCWGDGGAGQLGYGDTENLGDDSGETPGSLGPVDLGSGRTALAISAGSLHTCALLDDGNVRCWGAGFGGQLGYGNPEAIGDDEAPGSVGPVDLGAGRTAIAVAAGADHTCAVLDDGSVRCWGNGFSGQLGYGSSDTIGVLETPGSVGPVDLGASRTAIGITAGGVHTCVLVDDATVKCWGDGTDGQLGYGNNDDIGDDETPAATGPVVLVPEPPPGNNDDNGSTVDLGVVLTAAAGPFAPGATVPLIVDVANTGIVDAPNAKVVVTLPPQFVAGSVSSLTVIGPGPADYTCSPVVIGRVLTCTVATHPAGATARLTFTARLGPDVPGAGEQVVVRADVSSDGVDPAPGNDSSTVVVSLPTFVSITPTRVVDTRSSLGVLTEAVAAGSTIKIPITALDSIPDGATSAVVNLTSTRNQEAGFLTLHACTAPRPDTSNSNYRPGADTANLTISTIGADGAICLYTSAAADLIVDVVAYTTAGFTPAPPQRLADTRTGTTPTAGSTIRVPLPAGTTHVVNVTSTRSTAAGFLTAHDCDVPRPTTSNLNYSAGVDIANLTIASADGELCVYTSSPTDIIVDHLGTLSNATSALARLVDTRTTTPATPGTTLQIPAIATTNPIAAINLTATRTTTAGFLTVHTCNQPVPNTSNLNVTPGRDIANLAIIPTTTPICVTIDADTDVIIDLQTTVV